MQRKYLVLALLIAGLVMFAPVASAQVAPNPDNAAGIDLHSNTVVNGLVVGVSDITSGNTIQVGPVGGVYSGSSTSVAVEANGAQVYTGATVLTGVVLNPNAASEYIEIYDGTARGDHTTCLMDIPGGASTYGLARWDGAIQITTGIYAYSKSGNTSFVQHRIEDQGE